MPFDFCPENDSNSLRIESVMIVSSRNGVFKYKSSNLILIAVQFAKASWMAPEKRLLLPNNSGKSISRKA